MIAALGADGGIGYNNDLPWKRLPSDMQYFMDKTMGHAVVMGRKTWDSIPAKYRPLSGRRNFVMSRRSDLFGVTDEVRGAFVLNTVENVLKMFEEGDEDVYIIGGSEIYAMFMSHATKLLITRVNTMPMLNYQADTFFPAISDKEWRVQPGSTHAQGPKDALSMMFHEYVRIKK